MPRAFLNGTIRTGAGFIDGHALLTDAAQIVDNCRADDARLRDAECHDIAGKPVRPA